MATPMQCEGSSNAVPSEHLGWEFYNTPSYYDTLISETYKYTFSDVYFEELQKKREDNQMKKALKVLQLLSEKKLLKDDNVSFLSMADLLLKIADIMDDD
jgi:hypothetical protein